MKQSSKRLMSMLLSAVMLLAAFLIFFNFIQPAYGVLQEKKGEEISKQALLLQEQNVVDQAKKLLDSYQKESQAQSTLALAMPSGVNVAAAVAEVYGAAQNNAITIKGITITQTAPTPRPIQPNSTVPLTADDITKPLGRLDFHIQSSGSYASMRNFLAQLETNIRVFDVRSISMQEIQLSSASGANSVQDLFTYDIEVETYYQLP